MFYRHSEFISLLTSHRVLNIRGAYGSGKTLLSVALSFYLWQYRYIDTIYSNFPMAGRSNDYYDVARRVRFCMILDEASVILDSRAFARNASKTWLKDLRKRESVLIMPAKIAVDSRFRELVCQRVFAFSDLLWIYRWELNDGVGITSDWFVLYNPRMYYNSYSTKYSPVDEDFERLEIVMSGELPSISRSDIDEDYKTVIQVPYEDLEGSPFKKQIIDPKIFSIFSSRD